MSRTTFPRSQYMPMLHSTRAPTAKRSSRAWLGLRFGFGFGFGFGLGSGSGSGSGSGLASGLEVVQPRRDVVRGGRARTKGSDVPVVVDRCYDRTATVEVDSVRRGAALVRNCEPIHCAW